MEQNPGSNGFLQHRCFVPKARLVLGVHRQSRQLKRTRVIELHLWCSDAMGQDDFIVIVEWEFWT